MDRVGGYEGFAGLCEDARAYEDVLIVMRGEATAQRAREREAKRRR